MVAEQGLVGRKMGGYRGTWLSDLVLRGIEARVQSIVGLHRDRWRCVMEKGHVRHYQLLAE